MLILTFEVKIRRGNRLQKLCAKPTPDRTMITPLVRGHKAYRPCNWLRLNIGWLFLRKIGFRFPFIGLPSFFGMDLDMTAIFGFGRCRGHIFV
ncbi:hypothetical protein LXL04_036858 [Taraxacum kok-saghyz]